MFGTGGGPDKSELCGKIDGRQKHISVHLVCSAAVFDWLNRALRLVIIGLLVAIFGTTAWAESNAGDHTHAQTHSRTPRTHKNPPPRAKVAAKKKRPTVPHKKKAIAKRPKPVANVKPAQSGPRVAPKRHHEPLTQVRKVPSPALAEHHRPVEAEKPRAAKAGNDSPPSSEVATPAPPKPPEAPEVQAPKSPVLD